ncbi:ATP-binding protein [Deinococcus geothermalis]|nr:ATP-binding protein [Deinococcus geothermalis]
MQRLQRTLRLAVVAIAVPEGAGKTSLLAHLGRHLMTRRGKQVAWLSVIPDDVDRRQWGRSLARAFAHVGIGLSNYDQVATLADVTPELAVAALADDLTAHPEDVVLLIDDAHRLGEASARLLWMLVGAAQDNLQVALTCTPGADVLSTPRPPNAQLSVIPPDQLAFGLNLPEPDAVQSALEHLPPAVLEALTLAAPLDRWEDEAFVALGISAPPGWQAQVEAAGLPVLRQGDGLVPAGLLRKQLETRLSENPVAYARLVQQVGQRHAMRGRTLEALHAFVRAGAYDDALPLVQEMLPLWYRAGDWRLIVLALQSFPLATLPDTVLADLATARQELGDLAGVDVIETHLRERSRTPAGLFFVRALRAFREGDIGLAQATCEEGLDHARTFRDRIQLQRVLATVLVQQGRISEAGRIIRSALALAEALGDVPMLLNVLGLHGFQLEAQGDYLGALAVHERTFSLIERHRHDNNRLLLVAQRLASLRREAGNLSGALDILEVALQRLHRTHPEAVPVLLSSRSAVHLMAGHPGAALADAERAVSLAELWWGKAVMIDTLFRLTEVHLVAADLDAAQAALQRAQGVQGRFPANMLNEYRVFEAALLAARGHRQEAASLIEEHGLDRLSDWLDYGMLARAVVLLAAYERGDPLEGPLESMRRSMAARGAYALTRPLRIFPQLAQLLEGRVKANITALGRLTLRATRRPVLRVTTLDMPRLTLDGVQLRTRTGTAELLAYLALAPGQEELGGELAGNVIPAGGRTPQRKRLQVNRKELEESVAVVRPGLPALQVLDVEPGKNGRWSLSGEVVIECDALELYAASADDVMRLYRAPFLQDLHTEWAEEMRARLASHAAEVLRAGARETGGRRALQFLLRLLEIEPAPFDEDFEAALRLATQLGRPDLVRTVRRAQLDICQGERPVLSAALVQLG